ncbi:hypothetical protein Pint_12737 [Pistacia integerrima]|uniref:Uncharacterized protein n=1 Tax=Pistacia integerrima TaxID=434235 RepID=A0ACC0YAD5_9ROSI|nr:hypothetical protein Pint_12737 [Pistacia integerrima]
MEIGDHLEASEIDNLDIETEIQCLRERINKEDANEIVEKLKSAIKSLRALEKQESDLQSNCNAKRCELEAEVIELETKLAAGYDSNSLSDDLNESIEKLNLVKRELAARLRDILCVKRKLGDVPSHSELIQYVSFHGLVSKFYYIYCTVIKTQLNGFSPLFLHALCRYERRFSELYTHIQEKHQKTQKYYATYNALLEIKELMLKETSLLNSISAQFQDAITSTTGRMKLIDSMEKIVKGSQQKLEKVQLGLREEQKACDALKERHAAAVAEQRRCHSLLKAFQEECAKNERLQTLRSV